MNNPANPRFTLQKYKRHVLFTLSRPSGRLGSDMLHEGRVSLNPGLGGFRDVAFFRISHQQTQSNRICSFF